MKPPAESFPPPPFEGFPEDATAFFRELAEHQDRDWMAANKPRYEASVREPLLSLVADMSERLIEAGVELRGDPRRSVFRLNRDVRFSADKRPYKTNASAVFTRDGDKKTPGVLYFHFAPEGAFAAAGFFRPEPATLEAMRAHLAARADAWREIETSLEERGLVLSTDDVLKRRPRGHETAPPAVEAALKLKSWIVRRDLSLDVVRSPMLIDRLVELASDAAPLLRFGSTAIARAVRKSPF